MAGLRRHHPWRARHLHLLRDLRHHRPPRHPHQGLKIFSPKDARAEYGILYNRRSIYVYIYVDM